jgi:hypothetical protein
MLLVSCREAEAKRTLWQERKRRRGLLRLCPSPRDTAPPFAPTAMASSLYGGIAFKDKAAPPVLPAATADTPTPPTLSHSVSPSPAVAAAAEPSKDPKGEHRFLVMMCMQSADALVSQLVLISEIRSHCEKEACGRPQRVQERVRVGRGCVPTTGTSHCRTVEAVARRRSSTSSLSSPPFDLSPDRVHPFRRSYDLYTTSTHHDQTTTDDPGRGRHQRVPSDDGRKARCEQEGSRGEERCRRRWEEGRVGSVWGWEVRPDETV